MASAILGKYSGTYRAFHELFVIGGMEMPGAAD
jgi:hypothetical protein